MKLKRKYQTGGEVVAPINEQPMPAEQPVEQGGDALLQLAELFATSLQNQDCEGLAQGAQMFLELLQQASGGAPEGGQPVFAKGGKMVARKQASFKLVRG